jgi:hypothetical protein
MYRVTCEVFIDHDINLFSTNIMELFFFSVLFTISKLKLSGTFITIQESVDIDDPRRGILCSMFMLLHNSARIIFFGTAPVLNRFIRPCRDRNRFSVQREVFDCFRT